MDFQGQKLLLHQEQEEPIRRVSSLPFVSPMVVIMGQIHQPAFSTPSYGIASFNQTCAFDEYTRRPLLVKHGSLKPQARKTADLARQPIG
jgi:hypothetical protein